MTITAVGVVAEYVVGLARQERPAYHVDQVVGIVQRQAPTLVHRAISGS